MLSANRETIEPFRLLNSKIKYLVRPLREVKLIRDALGSTWLSDLNCLTSVL